MGSNGQLRDLIMKPTTKDEFEDRIQKALNTEQTPPNLPAVAAPITSTPPRQSPPRPTVEDETPPAAVPVIREARTAVSKGKQKQQDPPPATTAADNTKSAAAARNDWLEQQRKRKSEAKVERERIMAQIEADKAERRARREQDKSVREQQAASSQLEQESTQATMRTPRTSSKATTSNLQVHLLDGGKIRKQFPAEANLETDVRPWIDSQLETKVPYTFKQILAPLPARPISIAEEHASLRDLDLLPSATLVLQPIQTFSDAYDSSSGGLMSLPYTAVSGAYVLVSGTITGAANWLRGGLFRPEDDAGGRTLADQPPPQPQEGSAPTAHTQQPPATSGRTMRMRTLADQRDGSADQKFYNGNSLDFEPNADEKSKKQ